MAVEDQIRQEFDTTGSTVQGDLSGNADKAKSVKYYKSRLAGLSFLIKASEDGNSTKNVAVRFVPYWEKFQGDDIKVGYLKTDVKQVQEAAKADVNVSEITADEYEKAIKGRQAGY